MLGRAREGPQLRADPGNVHLLPPFPSKHPDSGQLPSSQEQPARPLTLSPATSIPAAPRALPWSFSSTLNLTLGVQVSGCPSRCQPAPP